LSRYTVGMLVAGEVICGLPWGVFQVRPLNRLVFRVSRLVLILSFPSRS
jgi:hypothetical protein